MVLENSKLIKEIEALKLKQKLLINSVKTKVSVEREKGLLELSSKVDFLVSIFSDLQNEDTDSKTKNSIFRKGVLDKVEELADYTHNFLDKIKKEIKEEVKKDIVKLIERDYKIGVNRNQNNVIPNPGFLNDNRD